MGRTAFVEESQGFTNVSPTRVSKYGQTEHVGTKAKPILRLKAAGIPNCSVLSVEHMLSTESTTGSPSCTSTSNMGPHNPREDTPLITRDDTLQDLSPKPTTPLPWQQLSILLLLHLAEPITSQVISPFLPQVG